MSVWIGFDMDECLGQFLSLWPFCEILTNRLVRAQKDMYLKMVARRIEESHQHWLFRPGINSLLRALVEAQNEDRFFGCFILSNNGSQYLVEVVRQVLNIRASRFGSKRELFLTGWSRNSPCRKGDMKKSLEEIQTCLTSEHLPGVRTLLFFDDMDHVLARQIPFYTKVLPYTHYTPVDLIYHILTPVFQQLHLSSSLLQAVTKRSKTMEREDMRDSTLQLSSPHSSEWAEATDALAAFLYHSSSPRSPIKLRHSHHSKRTRKQSSHPKSHGTRKSTTLSKQTKKSRLWARY